MFLKQVLNPIHWWNQLEFSWETNGDWWGIGEGREEWLLTAGICWKRLEGRENGRSNRSMEKCIVYPSVLLLQFCSRWKQRKQFSRAAKLVQWGSVDCSESQLMLPSYYKVTFFFTSRCEKPPKWQIWKKVCCSQGLTQTVPFVFFFCFFLSKVQILNVPLLIYVCSDMCWNQ